MKLETKDWGNWSWAAVSSRSTSILALTATLVGGCGGSQSVASGGGEEVKCPDGSARPGVSIVTVNCRSLVQFDATDLEASIDIDTLASAGIKNTKKTLREVSEAAEEAQVQFAQTCEMYNACAVTSAEFRDRTDQAQAHFRAIREKVDLLKSAGGDPAVVREAFSQLYEETVLKESRSPEQLLLELSVLGSNAGAEPRILTSGAPLETGARIIFGVRVSASSYVYLFQRKQSGHIDLLFPSPSIANMKNPLAQDQVLRIPPEGQVFTVDDQDLGQEVVHVVASRNPLVDLEKALMNPDQDGESEELVRRAMVELFDDGTPECENKTRGLAIELSDPCASMTRGLSVESGSQSAFFSSEASIRSQSVPGDDVILQTFTFQHAQ